MKPTCTSPPTEPHVAAELPSASASSDQLLGRALKEWQDAIDAGLPLRREELLDKYPGVRADLSGCLDGLNLIREIATQVDGTLDDENSPAAPSGNSEMRNPKSHHSATSASFARSVAAAWASSTRRSSSRSAARSR